MRNSVPFVLFALLGLAACERQVLGETFEGQQRGGRSLVVTNHSPAIGGAQGPHAPSTEPPMLSGSIPTGDSDPAIRGQLLAAGGLGAPVPQPRRARPSGGRPPMLPRGVQLPRPASQPGSAPAPVAPHAPHPGH